MARALPLSRTAAPAASRNQGRSAPDAAATTDDENVRARHTNMIPGEIGSERGHRARRFASVAGSAFTPPGA